MIIAVHTSQVYNLPTPLKLLCAFGQMGTSVFFVISGFALMKSQENKQLSVKKFYINRWLSVAPGYYFSIIFFFLLNLVKMHFGSGMAIVSYVKGTVVNLLLLNGLIPAYNNNIVPGGWFVGTTVLIYLIFPLLNKIMKNNHDKHKIFSSYLLPLICGIVWDLIIGLINYLQTGSLFLKNNSFWYFSVINQLPCFLCGVVLFHRTKDKNHRVNSKYIILSCVLYVLAFFLFHSSLSIRFYILPFIVTVATSILLEYLLTKDVKGIKFVNILGRESYGIYLIHSVFAYQLSAVVKKLLALNNIIIFVPMYFAIVLISLHAGKCINNMCIKFKTLKYR